MFNNSPLHAYATVDGSIITSNQTVTLFPVFDLHRTIEVPEITLSCIDSSVSRVIIKYLSKYPLILLSDFMFDQSGKTIRPVRVNPERKLFNSNILPEIVSTLHMDVR